MTWKNIELSEFDWEVKDSTGRFLITPRYDSHNIPLGGCKLHDNKRLPGHTVGFLNIKAAKEEAEKRMKE